MCRASSRRDTRRELGELRLETRLSWALQLVDALRHLHRQHILHRDIKPENIFLTADLRGAHMSHIDPFFPYVAHPFFPYLRISFDFWKMPSSATLGSRRESRGGAER